jgi:hypothetical protein
MGYTGTPARKDGFLSTGRLMTWGALLVIAGIAAPSLRSGNAEHWMSGAFRSADSRAEQTPVGSGLTSVQNRVRTFTTRSRMRGLRAELKLWVERHGTVPTGSLPELVGTRSATDSWDRPMSYLAPTASTHGWLRSQGPNPKSSKDDIWLPLSLTDLR